MFIQTCLFKILNTFQIDTGTSPGIVWLPFLAKKQMLLFENKVKTMEITNVFS